MKMVARSRKMAQIRPEGTWQLRVFHRNAVGKRDPRYLIKCGCCNEKVEIYYGGGTLEINGVMGSVENWGEVLRPLLKMPLAARAESKRGVTPVPNGTPSRAD
jgi:hypothetical protein